MTQDRSLHSIERNGSSVRITQRWFIVLLLLLGLSLGLHLWTFASLAYGRAQAREQLAALATQVAAAQQEVLVFDVPINQTVPVNAEIPLRQHMMIPISTTVVLNRSVAIPLTTPLGETRIPVPIDIEVPINTTVPVLISDTVAISAPVMLNLTLPIEIPISQSPFAHYLDALERTLDTLRKEL